MQHQTTSSSIAQQARTTVSSANQNRYFSKKPPPKPSNKQTLEEQVAKKSYILERIANMNQMNQFSYNNYLSLFSSNNVPIALKRQ